MQATLIDSVLEALRISIGFLWTVAWAISMGLTITSLVQVYVSKERMARVLGDGDLSALAKTTTIAVLTFVGSMGNVPFAVALWGGGISFAGVIAFVYADLITIPVLNVYRKYYGWRFMLYILGVFFVTMANQRRHTMVRRTTSAHGPARRPSRRPPMDTPPDTRW